MRQPSASDAREPGDLRILEIGHQHFAKTMRPAQTTLVWTGPKPPGADVGCVKLGVFSALSILRRLARREDDLVIVYVEQWAPWHWKQLRRLVCWRPLRMALTLSFVQFLRAAPAPKRMMVIDLTEWGLIHRYNEFLLDRCVLWFKRELPQDRWRVFRRSGGGGHPAGRFRRNRRNQARIGKIRPLDLGCSGTAEPEAPFPHKTADVFAAVMAEGSSTVRTEGLRELRALRAAGIAVDIPETRLDPQAFRARMAAAWLTWSPHGFGWDCFRHYEAPLAQFTPVISAPTIVRQFPLREGEHCFYYAPDEAGELGRVIRAALADKERLERMARAAREHVTRHHLWPDRIEALIAMALDPATAPGALAAGEGADTPALDAPADETPAAA